MTKRPIMSGAIFFFAGLLGAYIRQFWFVLIMCAIALWQLRTNHWKMRLLYLMIWMMSLFLGYERMNIHLWNQENQRKLWNQQKAISGIVTGKEKKKDQFYYFIRQKDCLVLAISNQNQIPIHATVVASGIPQLFQTESNDGGYNERSYYEGLNCIYQIKNAHLKIWRPPPIPLYESLYLFRTKVTALIQKALGPNEEGVLAAMITGEKSLLEKEVKESYCAAGISHLLAISGTHLSILILGCYQLLRKRKLSYFKSVLFSGTFLLCFSIMSGLSVSTIRAAIMMSLFLLSQIFGTDYDGYVGLSIAAVLILLFWPLSFLSISFQYSFLASYGALTSGKLLRLWFKKIHPLLSVAFMSSWITFLCFPLNLYHSYVFSSYQVLINAIVLPLAGVLLGIGVIGSLVGLVCFPMGKLLLMPCGWILKYYLWIARKVPQLPNGQIVFGKPDLWIVITTLLLSILFLYCLQDHPVRVWTNQKKLGGASARTKIAETFLFCGIIVCMILLCMPRVGEEDRITMLDVGQGDGIYLFSKGKHIMIDGGSTSQKELRKYTLQPYFNYHQIRQIHCWFLSHCDLDHCNGLLEVVESGMKVRTVIFSNRVEKNENYRQLVRVLKAHQIRILTMSAGNRCKVGAFEFEALDGMDEGESYDCNEKSLILKVLWGKKVIGLFGGDISARNEKVLVKRYAPTEMTVLKLSHHGSNGSNQTNLLKWCRPKLAIVSAGEKNRYHHPGEETLRRLKESQIPCYLTRETGQIDIILERWTIRLKNQK